jgi:pimeloyl-ACP methyl ester carboxylesterase
VLKLDRFSLVGLSLGGQLAALFASQHGHRLKKLALIAPVGMIHTHQSEERRYLAQDQSPAR